MDASAALVRRAARPLTTASIAGLKAGEMLADGAIRPGAGTLKVRRRASARGAITEFLYEFKFNGKTSRMALGRYAQAEAHGALTLAQARDEARRLQDIVRAGGSPLAQREIQREATRVQQAADLAETRAATEKTLGALLTAYADSLRERGKKDSAYDAANMFGKPCHGY